RNSSVVGTLKDAQDQVANRRARAAGPAGTMSLPFLSVGGLIAPTVVTRESQVPVLRVTGLTKRYGDEQAIDCVTFTATSGEVVGIIGPNGAGKTTLLETVVGLVSVDAGEVSWHGEPLPAPQRRNALFYLPDGVRPYRDAATYQVVSFFAGVYRRS